MSPSQSESQVAKMSGRFRAFESEIFVDFVGSDSLEGMSLSTRAFRRHRGVIDAGVRARVREQRRFQAFGDRRVAAFQEILKMKSQKNLD